MPPPKDPEKLKAYKEKLSRIAKERGYGKWMKGRKLSEEVKQNMSLGQKKLITPEERERRSKRAKNNGYGKWMKGKKLSDVTKKKIGAARKGKTYEELYGDEAADKKQAQSDRMKESFANGTRTCSKAFLTSGACRKNKTYAEIYGEEQAIVEAHNRSMTHQKKWEGKERKGCRDKHNGEVLYTKWRAAVFARDNYTCQDCGGKKHLQAHHIKEWSMYVELRYDVDNGKTACVKCHCNYHPNNGGLKALANKLFN